jgi:hypothetical protein
MAKKLLGQNNALSAYCTKLLGQIDKDANGSLSRKEFKGLVSIFEKNFDKSIKQAIEETMWGEMSVVHENGEECVECEDLRAWLAAGAGEAASVDPGGNQRIDFEPGTDDHMRASRRRSRSVTRNHLV